MGSHQAWPEDFAEIAKLPFKGRDCHVLVYHLARLHGGAVVIRPSELSAHQHLQNASLWETPEPHAVTEQLGAKLRTGRNSPLGLGRHSGANAPLFPPPTSRRRRKPLSLAVTFPED